MHNDYILVSRLDAASLIYAVSRNIQLGWQAPGGIAVAPNPNGKAVMFVQAMVMPKSGA